jgi:hypothetical protein
MLVYRGGDRPSGIVIGDLPGRRPRSWSSTLGSRAAGSSARTRCPTGHADGGRSRVARRRRRR